MSTWMDDLRRDNPALAADIAIAGNQPTQVMRNMVFALEKCAPWLNTPEDNARLAAAKRILACRKRRARA